MPRDILELHASRRLVHWGAPLLRPESAMTIILSTQRLFAIAAVTGAALLAGCASFNSVSSTVATFGAWPAGQAPGTYAFDRLPSQDANPQRQQSLENAAAQALSVAGFRPAPEGTKPAVTIQIGARTERFEASPWDDPFWFSGRRRFGYGPGAGFGHYGPYGFAGYHRGYWGAWPPEPDVYLHEVGLLIRDAETGKPLYEARASSDGISDGGDRLLAAMFDASLREFPHTEGKAHTVVVPLPMVPSAVAPPVAASTPAA
jgi:hypothetical protein